MPLLELTSSSCFGAQWLSSLLFHKQKQGPPSLETHSLQDSVVVTNGMVAALQQSLEQTPEGSEIDKPETTPNPISPSPFPGSTAGL